MKIYTASKCIHAALWRTLRDTGYQITSTWIDEAGQGESNNYSELATRCLDDITKADLLLLYCNPGEILKGALIEVGVALAQGKRVLCVGTCASISPVFKEHPLWSSYPDLTTALQELSDTPVPAPLQTHPNTNA